MSGVDIAGLVERLRSLADCDARAGEPLGKCMRRAADALLAQAAELAEVGARHQKQVDYSIDLQRIVEALCDGRMPPEPETSARHHYDMAVEATRQRDEALAALKASEDALKPFAAIDSRLGGRHAFDEWVAGSVVFGIGSDRVITVGDLRRARSALENSKARLADAKNDPADSDLSSLRKGAEVVGEAAAYDFVAGWHERQAKLFREMAEDDPRTAEPQRKRAFEAAIHHAASAAALRNRAADDRRAALVSGSREDGDG